jgi:Mg-chelatase subunit ChlD
MPSSSASGASIASSENNGIKILGIDSTAFPKIKANIIIDKFCAMAGNLKKEDFKVKEDDIEAAIDNLYFSGNASGQKIDLAIVFDETTSMDEEINALKSKVKDLTQKINSSKLDARYSLVTFNGADVATKINWTNDADSFRNIIGKLSTSGGNTDLPENSLDGIERALSFGFRPDTQKVIIVVTDEPSQQKGDGKSNSAYTMDDVKSDLLNSSVMLIAVSPDFRNSNVDPNVPRSNLPKYADMRVLANEAGSLWIDMNSADFSTILKQIQGILTGIYVIEYTSPDQTPSENRTVFISVDAPGCLKGSASGIYTTPESAPVASQGALSISGRIFDDSNGDRVKGTDEAGLEGWDVLLERPDGGSTTAKTDRKGYYIFTGLLPGSYALGAVAQGNWTATVPAEGIQAVELADTHESEIDFGFRLPLANQPPTITDLVAEPESPQDVGSIITWTAEASDPDGDQILYRFFLNVHPTTDWQLSNQWTWAATEGEAQVEVQVRDGKHAGPNEMDDARRAVSFNVTALNAPPVINDLTSDKASPQEIGSVITWTANATDPDGDQILYRFFVNDTLMTDWRTEKTWTWIPNAGSHRIEAQVRDGKHADPNGYDDRKSARFEISGTDSASSVQQTGDGGYIIAGTTDSYGAGQDDAWLIKTDSDGNELWNRTFGGPKDDSTYSVQQTTDGGYIIAGTTESYGAGQDDAWLIKTDSSGNKLWDKTFGGPKDDSTNSVQQTTDGGYIIAGTTCSYSDADPCDAWLIKTDSSGNKLWDKTLKLSYYQEGFGSRAYSVQQTTDGGYIVGCPWGESEDRDVYLTKVDANGNTLWMKPFHKPQSSRTACSVQQTTDGGYIIVGNSLIYITTGISVENYEISWLIKTDTSGNLLWDKTFGKTEHGEYMSANSIRQTSDGGYIIAGSKSGSVYELDDVYLIKLDAGGNLRWDKTFGGVLWKNDGANSVQQTTDGGYIIAGYTQLYPSEGCDAWLIKTDSAGNKLWDRTFGG